MIKRHEVQVLLRSGMSHRQVARQTGVSKRTVTRIAQEKSISVVDDLAEVQRRGIGRPSPTATFEEQIQQILEEKRDLPTVEVLHRLRQQGYRGGKTAVYDLVRRLRGPVPTSVMIRFEGLAGEFAQFDFGQVQVCYLSGQKETLHFACYRLKYSRWVHVEITPNEQVEPLCRALLSGFQRSGGAPLAVVFDNPKTVVIHPKQTPIVWNRTLAQLAIDFGFGSSSASLGGRISCVRSTKSVPAERRTSSRSCVWLRSRSGCAPHAPDRRDRLNSSFRNERDTISGTHNRKTVLGRCPSLHCDRPGSCTVRSFSTSILRWCGRWPKLLYGIGLWVVVSPVAERCSTTLLRYTVPTITVEMEAPPTIWEAPR